MDEVFSSLCVGHWLLLSETIHRVYTLLSDNKEEFQLLYFSSLCDFPSVFNFTFLCSFAWYLFESHSLKCLMRAEGCWCGDLFWCLIGAEDIVWSRLSRNTWLRRGGLYSLLHPSFKIGTRHEESEALTPFPEKRCIFHTREKCEHVKVHFKMWCVKIKKITRHHMSKRIIHEKRKHMWRRDPRC